MKVLILSRGKRLSPLFSNIGKSLAEVYGAEVAATLGYWSGDLFESEYEDWKDNPNHTLINLPQELSDGIKLHKENLIELAQEIEAKLKLSAFKSASNFLLYRKFFEEYTDGVWPDFYTSEEQIIEEYVASYLFFNKLFDQYQFDLVVCETPDIISHRVAQAVAYHRGIFQIGLSALTLLESGYRVFTVGVNRYNLQLDFYYNHPNLIQDVSREKAKNIIKKAESGELNDAKHIQHYRKNIKMTKPSISNYLKAGARSALKRDMTSLKRVKDRAWLDQHCKTELPSGSYIIFFMHYQPEAATCMVSPRWCNQEVIIEQLSLNAPAGMKVVVKENPKQIGMRGRDYYEKLTKFPNVHLLDPRLPNDELIKGCDAVVLISGNIALQVIACDKPVGVLSNTYYTAYKNICKLDYPEDIYKKIKHYKENSQVDRENFIAASLSSAFYTGEQRPTEPWPVDNEEGGRCFGGAINSLIDLIKENNLSPKNYNIEL